MKHLLIIASLFAVVLLQQGCFKNDPIDVPAYIYLNNINLAITDPATQGSGSAKIIDAWVSVDGQLIGVKDFPVLLPVLFNDSFAANTIKVGAGIEKNGISGSRLMYPFYARYETQRALERGKIDTLFPVVNYDPNCTIRLVENFENAGVDFGYNLDQDSITTVVKDYANVFEGTASGRFVFNDSSSVLAVATSSFSNLQGASTAFPVYIELNYKTDVAVEIGVIAFNGNIQTDVAYLGGVNPSTSWKKIYFDITNKVWELQAQKYALTFRAFKNDSVPNPNTYIDNLKILHY